MLYPEKCLDLSSGLYQTQICQTLRRQASKRTPRARRIKRPNDRLQLEQQGRSPLLLFSHIEQVLGVAVWSIFSIEEMVNIRERRR